MDARQALKELQSTECQHCHKFKKAWHSLCARCYRKLPAAMAMRLWQRLGEGYEGAYQSALDWLKENAGRERPHPGPALLSSTHRGAA